MKKFTICFYGLIISLVILLSYKQAPKTYTVTLTKEQWKDVLWVISKSEAPGPVVKKVTDLINRQLPDTVKLK